MKYLSAILIVMLSAFQLSVSAQGTDSIASDEQFAVRKYGHRGEVVEILQTRNYTYLNVKESIGGKDSLQWLALPKFEPAVGNVFYFDSGLQMGEFHSNELDRTFPAIQFLGSLSTTPEATKETAISALPVAGTDTVPETPAEIHVVQVKEILQTSSYTYLRVKEGEKDEWVAITKLNATVGEYYHYDDAAPMSNFTSKELKRTFPEILFVANLKPGKGPEPVKANPTHGLISPDITEKQPIPPVKNVEVVPGVLTVAKIWEDPKAFEGKKVTVKGQVTRFSKDILNANWIHLEDGSAFGNHKDITITTTQITKVGDTITAEGVIVLNKDFGSGYLFEMMMETAVVSK